MDSLGVARFLRKGSTSKEEKRAIAINLSALKVFWKSFKRIGKMLLCAAERFTILWGSRRQQWRSAAHGFDQTERCC